MEMSDILLNKLIQVVGERYREGSTPACTVVVYNKTAARYIFSLYEQLLVVCFSSGTVVILLLVTIIIIITVAGLGYT